MEKEFMSGLMVGYIQDNIIAIKSMGGEFFNGQIKIDMREPGLMGKDMEKEDNI